MMSTDSKKNAWSLVFGRPSTWIVCVSTTTTISRSDSFTVDDMVLRRRQKTDGMHKLSSPWEGPYIVKAVTRLGSYRLCDQDGVDIPNSWHIEHLRRFYPWDVLLRYVPLMYLCISIMIFSMMFSPFVVFSVIFLQLSFVFPHAKHL